MNWVFSAHPGPKLTALAVVCRLACAVFDGHPMEVTNLTDDPEWIAEDICHSNHGFLRCHFSFRVPSARVVAAMRELAALEASVLLESGSVVEIEVEERLVLAAVATCLYHGGEYLREGQPALPS